RTLNSPVQAPRANAIMERWIGGCRRELLDRTLVWGQRHLLAGAARVREPPQPTPSAPLARTGRTTQAAACRPRLPRRPQNPATRSDPRGSLPIRPRGMARG